MERFLPASQPAVILLAFFTMILQSPKRMQRAVVDFGENSFKVSTVVAVIKNLMIMIEFFDFVFWAKW
jgi:hypothetical protein